MPSHNKLFHQKATLPLSFLIVGAGLGGLACAFNLVHAGHRVRIIEKRSKEDTGKSIAGVRVPPNLTHLLFKWGLGPHLEKLSSTTVGIMLRDGTTAEDVGGIIFPEEFWKDLQAHILNMRYSDLHSLLLKLALDVGVTIDYETEVVDIDPCGAAAPVSEPPPISIPKPTYTPPSNGYNKHIFPNSMIIPKSSTPPPPTIHSKPSHTKLQQQQQQQQNPDPFHSLPPGYDFSAKFSTSATTIMASSDSIDSSTIPSPGLSRRPLVKLANGQQVKDIDVVIGADGMFSTVRKFVFEDIDPDEEEMRANGWKEGGITTYQLTVPRSKLLNDPELLRISDSNVWSPHQNTYKTILTYTLNAERDVAVSWFCVEPNTIPMDTWLTYDNTTSKLVDPLAEQDASIYAPCLQKLLALGGGAMKTTFILQPPLDSWYHESGNVVLIGDAVHSILPGNINGSAMSVEDGVVLASLFSHLRTRSQIPTLLSAYQQIREERTAFAQNDDVTKVMFTVIPPGPERDARDEGLRQAAKAMTSVYGYDDAQEEMIRVELEQWAKMFWYDAYEEADGWWQDWGLTSERSSGDMWNSQSILPSFSVSVDVVEVPVGE